MTTRDSYQLPGMDECSDSPGDATMFFTVDANSEYFQIEVHMSDCEKTELISHHGFYQLKRLPFGLRNARATLQRVMDVVLFTVKLTKCPCIFRRRRHILESTREAHQAPRDGLTAAQGCRGSP